MLVKINEIKVRQRVRKDLGDMEALKNSLRTYGLLNPITLTPAYELVAGERRLEAARQIGWETINAVVLGKETDALRRLEMELEENNQRKEFTEEELLEGYHRLERLRNPPLYMRIAHFFARILAAIRAFLTAPFKKKKGRKASARRP